MVAIDPGKSKVGLVLAVGDNVIFIGSTTPGAFIRALSLLSRYYRNITLIAGRSASLEHVLVAPPPNVRLVLLEESDLPTLRLEARVRDDALDALRIYRRGKALLIRKAIEDATSSSS
ncbi:hypothetical protein IG193_03885 [Infirmifilum lucidum]|uniref:Uncharacterized protein n=1 Tax=Infirmifilum lucidum TaxID=2776706 RepID=A0A7L9FIR2_9CREN|nr:hypothetical protein [Infirmifilum lucidum]QOJ79607.1 hypothetical protein IG193_03885 [Infirmifilum lucidum]